MGSKRVGKALPFHIHVNCMRPLKGGISRLVSGCLKCSASFRVFLDGSIGLCYIFFVSRITLYHCIVLSDSFVSP